MEIKETFIRERERELTDLLWTARVEDAEAEVLAGLQEAVGIEQVAFLGRDGQGTSSAVVTLWKTTLDSLTHLPGQ